MSDPYRTLATRPELPALGWYVHVNEHPFHLEPSTWDVYGPYRWRWWAGVIAWVWHRLRLWAEVRDTPVPRT